MSLVDFRLLKSLLLFLLCEQIVATKWLLDNPGFNDAQLWDSEYLPCSLEEVLFPETYSAVLPLPKEVDVSGFILAKDGALLFNQDSTINLGAGTNKRSCENGSSRKALLKEPQARKWFDPINWRSTASIDSNKARTDMERVPCNNETVIIQRNGPLAIDLEYSAYMRLGQMNLAGSIISKDYLVKLLSTDIGQLLFRNSLGVTVEYYRNDVCGCHKEFPKFIELVCHNVLETCERPHCLVPITPFENCCAICGSILKFNVEHCDDSKLQKLRKHISDAINTEGLENDLDFYVSYINSPPYGNFLQAVIVDRNSYSGKSVAFVDQLNATDWNKLFSSAHKLEVIYSGRPYNPNITFFSVLLIILCLLFVSFVALVIFAHYSPENPYLRSVPEWLYEPRLWRTMLLRSPLAFARFDTRGDSGNIAGASTQEHENIVMSYDAENDELKESSFDNPMFGETSTKKSELKSEKEKSKQTVATIECGTLNIDKVNENEEQELTEIKLESSSGESDEEKETKE